ncbi:MAG: hypothetical protein BWY29_00902 [Microgenomates group bacterium ADurb.Bin238]|nr:MAG: hypothetical protein BWY29_00902 [Microgenomates group bacterium ADurb.Bin238]
MLVVKWLRPSDYPNNKAFMEAYNEKLAEVKIAEKFLSQFDATNIDAQIKNLKQQLVRLGE